MLLLKAKGQNTESAQNLQIITMFLKYLSSTKKHSDMTIVSTSVHFTRNFALVLPLNSFLNSRIKL